jgi:hypothetical protein
MLTTLTCSSNGIPPIPLINLPAIHASDPGQPSFPDPGDQLSFPDPGDQPSFPDPGDQPSFPDPGDQPSFHDPDEGSGRDKTHRS